MRYLINLTVNKFRNNKPFGPSKCPVYVRLPWIGPTSQTIANKISSSVMRCYNALKVRTIITTRPAFRSFHKDVLPIFQLSNLIYKFKCRCNSVYIGRTSQRLEIRIKQHVPRTLCNSIANNTSGHSQAYDSAIAKHLSSINACRADYTDECFSVLHRARSKQHLNILEAAYISFFRPTLCRQKPKHSLYLLGDISNPVST